jgi:hypothetical protein
LPSWASPSLRSFRSFPSLPSFHGSPHGNIVFCAHHTGTVHFFLQDLRDLLPDIVTYVFSLGGWAEDQKHLGFWSPQHKTSGGGRHLKQLLGAGGPLIQQLIKASQDPNLAVWPQWKEGDMPARVFRLLRNPRLAPFQEGTSRFLAMWQNPTPFEYYMICFTKVRLRVRLFRLETFTHTRARARTHALTNVYICAPHIHLFVTAVHVDLDTRVPN